MSEYPSNSNRAKEEQNLPQRRVEKVVSGEVTRRKKSGLDKIGSAFLANDVEDVKNYILQDVLVPTIKRAFYDIVCNGTGMLLGERNPQRGNNAANRVSYRSYYDRSEDERRRPSGNAGGRSRSSWSYTDLIFDNRGDAEVVLERMFELLERFEAVSVADLFDLADMRSEYTDNKYGWTNLDDAQVQRVRGGYIIQLPRAVTL